MTRPGEDSGTITEEKTTMKKLLKILGRTLLYVVIFNVLIVGSLALGRWIGLGRILFDIVSFLLFIGIGRLLLSLFSGDPIVLALDPAFWMGVVVTILMVVFLQP